MTSDNPSGSSVQTKDNSAQKKKDKTRYMSEREALRRFNEERNRSSSMECL